jgi:hypothetical protein
MVGIFAEIANFLHGATYAGMPKKPTKLEPGDSLLLQLDVLRVDEATVTVAITLASGKYQPVTIKQDSGEIVEHTKGEKFDRPKGLFDKPD